MPGQKITLSGVTFSDVTLPKIRDDSILSAGSLMLFDGSHSAGIFAGVPAVAATLPNVAWKEAAALIGSGDAATLALVAGGSVAIATKFLAERSEKGGLHGITSQTAWGAGQTGGYTLRAADAVRDYMYTNIAHAFYVSLWKKTTRKGVVGGQGSSAIFYENTASANLNYLFNTRTGNAYPSANGAHVEPAGLDSAQADGTNRFVSLKTGAVVGTGPASISYPTILLGTIGDTWGVSDFNKQESRIIYRAYIEDLTVSGRTYAEVDAIDYALWQKEFAAGGKFYGDTYTDPATLP